MVSIGGLNNEPGEVRILKACRVFWAFPAALAVAALRNLGNPSTVTGKAEGCGANLGKSIISVTLGKNEMTLRK